MKEALLNTNERGGCQLKCVLQTQFFISCKITGGVKVQKRYCNKIVKKSVGGLVLKKYNKEPTATKLK